MSVVTVLKQANIFFELTTIQLELIGSICEERTYQTGDMVFAENTVGAELYVIANGEVHIQIATTAPGATPEANATNTDLRTIAVLRRGQTFGEAAPGDEGRPTAAAPCTQPPTQLITIPPAKIRLLCETYPQPGILLVPNLS